MSFGTGENSEIAMLTNTQIKTAKSIVNIFETGEVQGIYGDVTLIEGDTGHLTFGRSQTTLASGGLSKLLEQYCSNPGARFASRLKPFLQLAASRDFNLDYDKKFHNILRATSDDQVMRETQDHFFDTEYWQPAEHDASVSGISSALGVAIVYDGHVHGSWAKISDRTNSEAGSVESLGEYIWIENYVKIRRAWLACCDRNDLRQTVYRMDAFQRLIDQGYWGLELPLVVRGIEISNASLCSNPRGCYDGPQPGTRSLSLETPLLRGLDVRLVQLALSDSGLDIRADGIYGQTSVKLMKVYQENNGLPVTGAVDISLISKLCCI
jgi:chitosanase